MKKLNELIKEVEIVSIHGSADVNISDVCMDSRLVSQNSLFVAICGYTVDGHQYIKQAVENKAFAVVCMKLPDEIHDDVTYIVVRDSSVALGQIASAFYNHPSKQIILVGITGTNGKTTIATLLFHLFKLLGYKTGLLSTVTNFIHDREVPATHTTPDQITLNKLLAEMVAEGCKYCFMEVSSHAVVQNRIAGVEFAGGVFTNLTHDHLDFHKDFKLYRDAKKRFFDGLPSQAFALSNSDDANGSVMLQNTSARKYYYSLRKPAQFKGNVIENTMDGLHMRINRYDVHLKLCGKFNAYNALAIFGTAVLLQQDEEMILSILSNLKQVDGRFHMIENTKGIYAIVDYAHTPDAVENVLRTINELRSRDEKLFVVIGAGGNRDKSKRPVMAAIAARHADVLILTSDNPRSENPIDIIDDMKSGLDAEQIQSTLSIVDRKEAIRTAVMMAQKGDIILVAGKGHETYQEINGNRLPFDDKKILSELLNQ